jgi:hypothetical protein
VEMQISIAIMENIMECYDNMDELEIIVKWNIPDTERQTLCDMIHMWETLLFFLTFWHVY